MNISRVLVKAVAITGAGRTINQREPWGDAGALTGALHSAGHTPAKRLIQLFSLPMFCPSPCRYFCHSSFCSYRPLMFCYSHVDFPFLYLDLYFVFLLTTFNFLVNQF